MGVESIPMPKSGIDAFDQGMQGVADMVQRNRALNIQQMQNARQQTILPYLIQQYQNKAKESQYQQNLMQSLMNGDNPQSNSQTPPDGGLGAQNAPGSAQVNPNMGASAAQSTMSGAAPAQQSQNSEKLPVPQEIHDNLLKNLKEGESKVVRNGLPGKDQWDKMAGMKLGNMQVPKVEPQYRDGMMYEYYPVSKKLVATKMGLSDAEQYQAKADIDLNKKDEESVQHLIQSAHRFRTLKKLLMKNPNLTGPGTNILGTSNDPDVATFTSNSGLIQSDLAKYANARGGSGGAGQRTIDWAKGIKPDPRSRGGYNMGMINSGMQNVMDEYNDMNAAYKKRTGKSLPGLPDMTDEGIQKELKNASTSNQELGKVTIVDSNGKEHTIDKDKIDVARQRDPGLKVKGA